METYNTTFCDDPNGLRGNFSYKLEVLDNATNKKYKLMENKDKIWNTFIESAKKVLVELPIEMPEDETEKLNAYYSYNSLCKHYVSRFIPEEFLVYIERYANVYDEEYGVEINTIPNYLALKIDYARDIENIGFEFKDVSIVAEHVETHWKPTVFDEYFTMSLVNN